MQQLIREPVSDKHYIAGGVYVKQLIMPIAGDYVISHKHNFDHLSLLASGRVKVEMDGVTTVYTGPTAVLVKADIEHKITALSRDVLWYCVHSVPEDLRSEDLIEEILVRQGE
jgi:quercetin dioxygenase-like cupin family protein